MEKKLSLKDAADSKLVKTLTHEDNRVAIIGTAVVVGLVVAGLAALFLTPQGKKARVQIADGATKGLEAGKTYASKQLEAGKSYATKSLEAGKQAATKGLEAGKSYADSTLQNLEQKVPVLVANLKRSGQTADTNASLN